MANNKKAEKFIENRAAEMRNACEEDIARMAEEVQADVNRERNRKCATELYDAYQAYIEVGFAKEEAWELIRILVSNGTKKTMF